VADLHEPDPITQANRAIEAFIRRCGGRIPDTAQPEYQRLVRAYLDAVAGDEEPEPEPLAA
jgi:hypothetical protein